MDLDALSIKFAKRLKDLRESRNKTQLQLANEISTQYGVKISDDSIMYYETVEKHHTKFKKNTGMALKYLWCFADYFEVSVDYLLGNVDYHTTDENKRIACEYTGLTEDVIDVFHLRSSTTFTEEQTIRNLNTFLEPSFLIILSHALDSFAGAIQVSVFDKLVKEAIGNILLEDDEYLKAENIDTYSLTIRLNSETLDHFSTALDMPPNLRKSIQFHLLHSLALPDILNYLEKDPTQIDRYAVSRTLEKDLDDFAKCTAENAQIPIDQSALENIIRALYNHAKAHNDLPKNAPTPNGLPF